MEPHEDMEPYEDIARRMIGGNVTEELLDRLAKIDYLVMQGSPFGEEVGRLRSR